MNPSELQYITMNHNDTTLNQIDTIMNHNDLILGENLKFKLSKSFIHTIYSFNLQLTYTLLADLKLPFG